MSINKFNHEGYSDPTAYQALTNIMKEAREKPFRPLVFICSPYAGDIESNILRAQGYCRYAVSKSYIPIAPHLMYPQFLDEEDTEQRNLGILFGLVLMSKCEEVWVFGEKVTKGMSIEIEKAKYKNIKIRYFDHRCEEVKSYGPSKGAY